MPNHIFFPNVPMCSLCTQHNATANCACRLKALKGLLGIQATSIVCEAGMKISTAAADFWYLYLPTVPHLTFAIRCEFSSAKNHESRQAFVLVASHCNMPDNREWR